MTDDQLALLADTRLPSAARIIGLIVSLHPDGWQASKADLAGYMGPSEAASDDTIARHLKRLESTTWIERKVGGRGHPDRFHFIDSKKAGSAAALRSAFLVILADSTSVGAEVSEDAPDSSPSGAEVNETYLGTGALSKNSSGTGAEVKPLSSGTGAALSAPSRARASTTTSLPPPPPPNAGARAREFIEAHEALTGCRGALRDYLATGRAGDEDQQLAYAQTVAGIVEGTDEQVWMKPSGSYVTERRATIIAGCLNEMRQGDEIGRYFPGPPGDVVNLRAKIRYKVKSIAGAERDSERKRGADPGPTRGKEGRPAKQVDVLR